mgnify:CR=1 FL=1|tara:strand:- start:9 stop:215 length:207 start_codon:yes stop_codon:yes gene_type:complete
MTTPKSYKREMGGAVLAVALAITIKFWWFIPDAATAAAYVGAWNIGVLGLAAIGLAPFGLDAVLKGKK